MKALAILAAVFVAGLGVVIGSRMSTEAMAVVVGVVLGSVASVPMALLVLLVRDRREEPPTVIIDGAAWRIVSSTKYLEGEK